MGEIVEPPASDFDGEIDTEKFCCGCLFVGFIIVAVVIILVAIILTDPDVRTVSGSMLGSP